MPKLVFYGWEPGLRPIEFVKMLKENGGLSLKDAKTRKDYLVNNGIQFELHFKTLEDAQEVYELSIKNKLLVNLVK